MSRTIERYNSKWKSLGREKLDDIFRTEPNNEIFSIEYTQSSPLNTPLTVAGRLVLEDRTGKISKFGIFSTKNGQEMIFLENLQDDSGIIEVYLPKTENNVSLTNKTLGIGDILEIEGSRQVDGNSQRDFFLAQNIKILTKAARDIYNVDKTIPKTRKEISSGISYIELIRNRDRFKEFIQASKTIQAIREFLYSSSFLEITTPILTEDFEGGISTPFKTFSIEKNRDLYLRVTGEVFFRKLMASGFRKIFEISRSFRNTEVTFQRVISIIWH